MIFDIRQAFTDIKGDLEIYSKGKIVYFANVRKKICLYTRDGFAVNSPMKKGASGRSTLCDVNKQKKITMFPSKGNDGKKNYGIHPVSEDVVYRAQFFSRDGVRYVLLTHDGKKIAVAKLFMEGRSLCKLYLRNENAKLSQDLLTFVLLYLKISLGY